MQQFFQREEFEKKLNLKFHNKDLLVLASVHRSFWNENQNLVSGHNERLEFLGDSVLSLVIGEFLFLQHPELDEGVLSMLRSQLVDASACSKYLQKLDVEEFLLLGKGELMNRGKGRDSILSDFFEAIVGALYLDKGMEKVREFFFQNFANEVNQIITAPQRNWKAELQDYTQRKYQETPKYEVIKETGPAHQKTFRVGVWVMGELLGEGEGFSKKIAQMQAAKNALERISEDE